MSWIQRARARWAASTKGTWAAPGANVHRVIAFERWTNGERQEDRATRLIVEHPEEKASFGRDDISYHLLGEERGGRQSAADRIFIAAAHQDLPFVLDWAEEAAGRIRGLIPFLTGFDVDGDLAPEVEAFVARLEAGPPKPPWTQ
jgi:hypothetical protein